MSWPKVALLSLADKRGAAAFAQALAARGTRILASGGTAKHLEEAGLEVTPVEQWTGSGELLGGRVKTLHPHVHAPILARRERPEDLVTLAERDLEPIDLVAVTLYPFEERAAALDEAGAVEEIDIGGVALLRAAAKNFASVIVVHDPAQYGEVLDALAAGVTLEQRRAWAYRTFARTARYDAVIAADLAGRGGDELPPLHVVALEQVRALRYGENPHQQAGLYRRVGDPSSPALWREGKELSFNNLLDVRAAVSLAERLGGPSCVVVKHGEPCGAASAESAIDAFRLAFATDELSAFGGVVALNRTLDGATAQLLAERFVECVVAPTFDAGARAVLEKRKTLRALEAAPGSLEARDPWELRMVGRWALLQRDAAGAAEPWTLATTRAPSVEEKAGLAFAWEVAAAARSNAAAIARGRVLVGLGSGQTSRVDAVDVAIFKARRAGHDLAGTAMASDGFFPFPDAVEHAAAAGVTAVVQPGGSKRDPEVIEACNRLGVAMMLTGRRTFRH